MGSRGSCGVWEGCNESGFVSRQNRVLGLGGGRRVRPHREDWGQGRKRKDLGSMYHDIQKVREGPKKENGTAWAAVFLSEAYWDVCVAVTCYSIQGQNAQNFPSPSGLLPSPPEFFPTQGLHFPIYSTQLQPNCIFLLLKYLNTISGSLFLSLWILSR